MDGSPCLCARLPQTYFLSNMTSSIPSFLTTIHKSVLPIEHDSNSFYRALAKSEYNVEDFHKTIRYFAMEYIKDNSEEYISQFSDAPSFWRCVNEHKQTNVWNTEMDCMMPSVIPEFLHIHLVIYDYDAATDAVIVYKHGDEKDPIVELLRTNHHYDLLKND